MKTFATLTAFGLALATQPVHADTQLRLAHWLPPQHSLQTTGFEPWIASIGEASGGKISFTIFPAQQLGSAVDHYDMAANGIADVTYVAPSYQPGRFPIISLAEHPFMVTDAITGASRFDKWYKQYAETEMPEVHVCMAFVQDPGTLHTVKPMKLPSDIRGTNIRPANAVMGSMVALLGGASVQVPAPEAREVIARGAADGITFPWDSIFLFGIDKETKYHIDMPLYSTSFVVAVNKATYEGMPEDERAVLDDHCTGEWAEKVSSGWARQEQSGREKALAAPDQIVHEPTAEELEDWKVATMPLMVAWREQVVAKGGDPEAVEASYREIMGDAGPLAD